MNPPNVETLARIAILQQRALSAALRELSPEACARIEQAMLSQLPRVEQGLPEEVEEQLLPWLVDMLQRLQHTANR